ncbi:MAG: SUMF1/EgtB/PvdO family nonheme iron enzyme [Anaerolineae bacterium]|nr:SUMF1/EgtB/PvdO family nonheme iron enzyme [Anaerolineae bacterium]
MEPFSTALLATALYEAGKTVVEKGVVDPALEKGLEPLKSWLTRGYDAKKADRELQSAFSEIIKDSGSSVGSDEDLADWLKGVGLDRLQAPKNEVLRKQVAHALIGFTDPNAPPPENLMISLGWPRSRRIELSALLFRLRSSLAKSESWRPLLTYANDMQAQGLLSDILQRVGKLESALVQTLDGNALRVVLVERGLSDEQLALIEKKYRENIALEFERHTTRGLSPAQLPKLIPMPLKDVYLELGLIPLRTGKELEFVRDEILQADQAKRLMHELRQQQERVTDSLSQSQKLVIVGKPGSGKTLSLKFIALMLAYGTVGANRLRLDLSFVPIYVRLAQYAEELKKDSFLALETFLMEYVKRYHPGQPHQDEFLQTALEQGLCMILLDGLDEVGDVGDTLVKGKTLRARIVEEVQRFSSRRCGKECSNRIVVTSRLEGYHRGDLPDFVETELSDLKIPDEAQEFLLRWFAAYEQEFHPELHLDDAFRKARDRVQALMSDIMRAESVQRLAINPLLLTILAMIHDMGARLPNQRVKLYETVAKTMIENWRIEQTRHDISIYEVIPQSRIMPILASLAYWIHVHRPGGSMPEADWRAQIKSLLSGDDEDDDGYKRDELVEMFMRHAREEVGLLTEKSPGQIGFFHLTLEEYLAAVDIARRGMEERRKRVKEHWADPYWREVILLTAGELTLRSDDLVDFINDLRIQDEGNNPELFGQAALLAGLAVADVGEKNFENKKVVREVRNELEWIAKDYDPETKAPSLQPSISAQNRAQAADVADELGYTIPDLYSFVSLPDFSISKYPVTNAQYERFLKSDFNNKKYWADFPKYDENSNLMQNQTWGNDPWDWLQKELNDTDNLVENEVLYPRYWRNPRFGISRRNAPVVGISWYEASAYCKWLLNNWDDLEEGKQGLVKPKLIRLPTDQEWASAAGGEEPAERFPWDKRSTPRSGSVDKKGATTRTEEIIQRANIRESGINRTTPVWMYPQGESTQGVMDMSGNVWEWQANYSSKEKRYLGLRGGSWSDSGDYARVSVRVDLPPNFVGLRCRFSCGGPPQRVILFSVREACVLRSVSPPAVRREFLKELK